MPAFIQSETEVVVDWYTAAEQFDGVVESYALPDAQDILFAPGFQGVVQLASGFGYPE